MEEIGNILHSVLIIGLLLVAGGGILGIFGSTQDLPGDSIASDLSTQIIGSGANSGYIGNITATSEESTGLGFGGVASLAKLVFIDAPTYSWDLIQDMANWFKIPPIAIVFFMAMVAVTIIISAALFLRGVK